MSNLKSTLAKFETFIRLENKITKVFVMASNPVQARQKFIATYGSNAVTSKVTEC